MLHHVIVGHGRPLLVLHGSPLDHRHMVESVEPVFESSDGWQRIYIDLPGHGQSPGQDSIRTQDDLLAAVMAFADDVIPGKQFGIIGESRGSYLARGFAHLRADRLAGVALIVPGGSPTADPARLPKHQVLEPEPAVRAQLAEGELARFDGFMVVQSRDIVEKTRRCKLPAIELFDFAQAKRVNQAFDFSFDVRGEKLVFEGPSLIVAGRQDRMSGFLDAIDLVPQFPRATLAILDCAGHGLAWERPQLFNALLRDWLMRLRAIFR